jgi:uncharacterized membrane protein
MRDSNELERENSTDREFPKLVRFIVVLTMACLALSLQGCWKSDLDLIAKKDAVDPFGGANDVVFTSSDVVFLFTRISRYGEFSIYVPEEKKETQSTVKFHNLTPFWKVYGAKDYAMGIKKLNNSGKQTFEYYLVTIDGNEVQVFGPDSSKNVNSLSELKSQISDARDNFALKSKFSGTLQAGNAEFSRMAKELIDKKWQEEKRLAKEKKEEKERQEKINSAKGLEICNLSSENIYIAFASLQDEEWISRGWYKTESGKCNALAKNISGKNYYYFAQGEEGGQWNGTYNLCFQPKEKFSIKGFNDCEKRGYKTGSYKKIAVSEGVWEIKESISNANKTATKTKKKKPNNSYSYNSATNSKLADLDIGEGVYAQGFFSDELVYVMRIDYQNHRVKVQRPEDGTAKWVSASDIISREQSAVNDLGRAAVTIGVFYCLFNPEEC